MTENERISQIISVAKLFYEENINQTEIAKILGVSRQSIGVYLKEANNLGLIDIKVKQLGQDKIDEQSKRYFCQAYNLNSVTILGLTKEKDINDKIYFEAFSNYIEKMNHVYSSIGIGWGQELLSSVELLPKLEGYKRMNGTVVPLIGNAYIEKKHHHSNEINRILEEKTGLVGRYLYCPAVCFNQEEKAKYFSLIQMKEIFEKYKTLTNIVVQVNDAIESSSVLLGFRDFRVLHEKKCVGTFLGYYYDIEGNIIDTNLDNVIQIDLKSFKGTRNRLAIIGEDVSVPATLGGLRTKLFTDIHISEKVFLELLKLAKNDKNNNK